MQPLIKHSLDYLIADKLKAAESGAGAALPARGRHLLRLRPYPAGCGPADCHRTGHRPHRRGAAVAAAFRTAVRDVIRDCIYGVDLNPLAVELCKVALWLEAHIPGQPLNFLDHHIKCGNAIVGFARREELERGVPDEAFATMPGDDKETAAGFRKRNKEERQATEADQDSSFRRKSRNS